MDLFRFMYCSLTFTRFSSWYPDESNSCPFPLCQENGNCCENAWCQELAGFLNFPFSLPSVPDVIIKFNQIKVSVIWALSFSTSLLLCSFLMQHNLQQLQDCFVSLHTHWEVQVQGLELDLLWLHPVGEYLREEFLLPEKNLQTLWWTEDAWQGAASLHHGPSLKPKVPLGVGWGRQELRAWLAMSVGGIKQDPCLVSSSCVSLSSLHHGLAPERDPACCSSFCELKRRSQHPNLPLATWDEAACHLLGKRRASWQCFGSCWRWSHALLLSRSAELQRGECVAAHRWAAAAGTLLGLWHSGMDYFLLLEC